jgi:hypothetical protein
MRYEALHYLHKQRPVAVSLHTDIHVQRAKEWASTLGGGTRFVSEIFFTGRVAAAHNDFYHITVESFEDKPFFRVRTRPGASKKASYAIDIIKINVLEWLDAKVKRSRQGNEATLSQSDIVCLIDLIKLASQADGEVAEALRESWREEKWL